MSLRARLALVLAGTLTGPLLAAGLVAGVLVPGAAERAADGGLTHALAAAALVLRERCLGLRDLASSAAARIDAAGPEARSDPVATSATLAPLAVARPGVTLLFTGAGQRIAGAGPQAATWDPASAATASCSRRAPGPRPELVESAALADVAGLPPSRVVAVQPMDGAALAGLRGSLGLAGVELALLLPDGAPVAVTGPVPAGALAAAAAQAQPTRPGDATGEGAGEARGEGAGESRGEAAGWRFRQRTAPDGVPYGVAVFSRAGGQGLPRTVLAVVLLATAALIGTATVLTSRLTRPLAELTAVALRLGGGDLTARTGISGSDEVGTLAAAFDTMAGDLQARVGQLRSSQDALSDTFARFGEALGATHDLDGLLRTVVAAAMRGGDAMIGIAFLGDASRLDRRLVLPDDVRDKPDGARAGPADPAGPAGSAGLAGLADLADDAVRRGELVVTDLVDAAGPALAVPLWHDGRVIGALAAARASGATPFDPIALAAVTSLASHAGTAVGNVRAHEETSRQSITDPLTGAGNLRHLTTTLAREVERARRFGHPLSVLMLDLDHFKQVNDSAGHAFGDAVLREFARRLAGCLREVDVVTRYGGEEFVVVLPETGPEGACTVATRVVDAVRKEPFRAGGRSRSVTVSVGVASFPGDAGTASELTRAADGALYAAKHAGRDRWALAGGSGSEGIAPARTG